MRIDNSTPFLFGYRITPWKRAHLEMTTVVRATFRLVHDSVVAVPEGHPLLVQGMMTGEVFHDDDDEGMGECLYPGDFADFKKNAEVMLRGACHVPGQQRVVECPVRFSVGRFSKILRVVGPRVFTGNVVGRRSTEPIPFTRMPIDYTHAYGGPGYDANPIGKGYGTDELPNIEYPGEDIRSPRDQARPAGFGPINPRWKSRAAKRGQKVSSPRDILQYPDDFDVSFFQSAPADQQLSGYLVGDEEIVLQNLHPSKPVIHTRLPGLRMRVFVDDIKNRFREVPMVIDTLFVDMDQETVTLTYRGSTPVEEYDLADVRSALIASENITEPPKPFAHYRAEHERNEADPYQLRHRIRDELRPTASEALHHHRIAAPVESTDPTLDPVSKLIQSKIGHLAPAEQARVREVITKLLSTKAPPGVDWIEKLKQAMAQAETTPPPAGTRVPGVVNLREYRVGATLERLRKLVEQLKSDPKQHRLHLEGIQSIERVLEAPRFASLTAEKPVVEPGPGMDLSGQDFSGRDFRGRDFSGANLTGAIFVRADLRDAIFRGARLNQAILTEAKLTGADLTLADMTRANASHVDFTDAKLAHTTLHQTTFTSANLERADLSEARGLMAIFSDACLSQARVVQASLQQCLFQDAKLQGADFSRAALESTSFLASDLTDARFDDATLKKTSFLGATAVRTSFAGATGEGPVWMNATLTEADFRYVSFERPFFAGAKVTASKFYGANLRGAQFHRATLDRAEMTRTNLAGANFSSAQLTHTNFNESNLFETSFMKASGRSCEFHGANLKRSTLEQST